MTQTARKPASTKKATILERNEMGNGKVETIVQSSNGKDKYTVVSINHVVESCECPHHTYRKVVCYHMRTVQIRELEIEEQELQAQYEAAMAAFNILDAANQIAAEYIEREESNMYSELASTKKVSVPANSGEDWDYCEGCQCRVKKGQRRCPNC